MIRVDSSACTSCGICVKVCHEHAISLTDNVLAIDSRICSTCAQCVAVCPNQALSWNGIAARRFERALLPSIAQFDELLKERRTVRSFQPDPVDHNLLEEITATAILAPTHNYRFRLIIVEDAQLIREFDRTSYATAMRLRFWLFNPLCSVLLPAILPPIWRGELDRARPKLEESRRRGPEGRTPPAALVAVVGDRGRPLSVESAQYSLYNMTLAAQLRGLGCQNLVVSQGILNSDPVLRKATGLARHELVYALMGLGHPAVRFSNSVEGKRMDMTWIGPGTGPTSS